MIITPDSLMNQTITGPLLGIDYGRQRVGLALSDRLWMIASPFQVLAGLRFQGIAAHLQTLVSQHGLQACILGLPLNADSKIGPQAQAVQQFAHQLSRKLTVPVCFWDERFSSIAAQRVLADAHTSRHHQREVIDKMAAAYMLQGFLDRYQIVKGELLLKITE